jgi:cysteine-rich repeat protein
MAARENIASFSGVLMRPAYLAVLFAGIFAVGCECGNEMGEDAGPDAGTDAGPPPDAPMGRCANGILEAAEECDDGNRERDDGCAPDCTFECGDGRIGPGELCDPGIAAGEEGACPSDCDDAIACTTDALDGTGCEIECAHADITAAADGDGCCPAGADATSDDDCDSVCDNGVVEEGETCDTAIERGLAGSCPETCDDSDPCTTDALELGGTCGARCAFEVVTEPADGDSCCPAGQTVATDADCSIRCGDGVRSPGEICDTEIAAGPGVCPSSCDDMVVCTSDELRDPATCSAICSTTAITMDVDGDGCCPPGSDLSRDSDCTGVCGDGTVSGGETCDTAIAAGEPGACPASCGDDGVSCTNDVLAGAGTCSATCSHPAITLPIDGDACCPSGETVRTDSDCPTICGDGVVTGGERCDTSIAAAEAGACPTSCSDEDVCTTDVVVSPGTCAARCASSPTPPGPMEGCCPDGATLFIDPDCPPACGDRVVTPPETCDDGNLVSGDGCSAACAGEPTAFRFSDLDLRDPHVYANAPLIGCADVTNLDVFGIQGVNPQIQINIQNDGDGNGVLDLSVAHVFTPLVQADGSMTSTYLAFPTCTAPMSTSECELPAGSLRTAAEATMMGGGAICLDRIAGTTRATYTPAIVVPTAPASGTCYVASAGTVVIDLAGIALTLQDAQIAGEWFGTPATQIRDGMIRGFVSEADADATLIPEGTTGIDTIDGEPLSSLLRGGTGNCREAAPAAGDSDTFVTPDGTTIDGWYFYLNFTASSVVYSEL